MSDLRDTRKGEYSLQLLRNGVFEGLLRILPVAERRLHCRCGSTAVVVEEEDKGTAGLDNTDCYSRDNKGLEAA